MEGDGGGTKKKEKKKRERERERERQKMDVLFSAAAVKDTGGVSCMVIYYRMRLPAGCYPRIGAGIFGMEW